MLLSIRGVLFEEIKRLTWLSKHTQSTEVKFQDIFINPDQNFLHVVILLEHGTILHQQREILCQLLVRI